MASSKRLFAGRMFAGRVFAPAMLRGVGEGTTPGSVTIATIHYTLHGADSRYIASLGTDPWQSQLDGPNNRFRELKG